MATPFFGLIVPRHCRVRTLTGSDSTPFQLTAEGFLDADAVWTEPGQDAAPGAIVGLSQLGRQGAVVLLGEPGLGKTTAIDQYIGQSEGSTSSPSAVPRKVIRLSGPDLLAETFDQLIGEHLRRVPDDLAQLGNREPVDESEMPLVVIDQLDESPILRALAARLKAAATGQSRTGSFRFFVASRTADYPAGLTEALEYLCGTCVLVDLAPLTRQQAIDLASTVPGLDGDRLIESAGAARCAELATVPLTLELLARSYLSRGSLDGSTQNIFIDGIVKLLEDPDPAREALEQKTSLSERREAAEAIACSMILCGRRAIWRGPTSDAGPADITLDTSLDTTNPRYSKSILTETLRTAIFSSRGTYRFAFRHSSLAAYLAAVHLIKLNIPVPQLERLFLVAAADKSTSIPEALRETAAWLVTLAPGTAEWLISADPQSLAGYSPIVDSASLRKLIVAALLRRAPEIELMDVHGLIRGLGDFTHPELGDQLLEALAIPASLADYDWAHQSRIMLAVRLARHTQLPELVQPLIEVSRSDSLPAHIRKQAALAAYETSPNIAAPILVLILEKLADEQYALEHDPDDEILGSVLEMLYPAHVSTEAILKHLLRVRRSDFIGTYRRFFLSFASKLPQHDVEIALAWAIEKDDAASDPHLHVDASAPRNMSSNLLRGETDRHLDLSLVDDIIDRAMSVPDYPSHCDSVALLALRRIRAYKKIPLPTALDSAQGECELASSMERRHALAVAIVSAWLDQGTDEKVDAEMLIGMWTPRRSLYLGPRTAPGPEDIHSTGRSTLLDVSDFPWLFDKCAEVQAAGDARLADGLARLAEPLFDLADQRCSELVYRNQDHPVWAYVKYWYETIGIDSELATLFRARRERNQQRELKDHQDRPEAMPEAELQQQLMDLLEKANTTDPSAFWLVAWNLQLVPGEGGGPRRFDDDITDFPSFRLIRHAGPDVAETAIKFLATEHDRSDGWLGTNKYDNRGWAGYLALALLARQDRLDEVPATAWRNWAGTTLWFDADSEPEQKRRATLFQRIADNASDVLANKIGTYLFGEVRAGRFAQGLRHLDPSRNPEISATWHRLINELRHAIAQRSDQKIEQEDTNYPATGLHIGENNLLAGTEAWDAMMDALWATDGLSATEMAHETLAAALGDSRNTLLAVRAARMLLTREASASWDLVLETSRKDKALGREIALGCASRRDEVHYTAGVTTPQLGEIYQWLAAAFPHSSDSPRASGFLSPEQQAREWRDRTVGELGERGTDEAIAVLVELKALFPKLLIIDAAILRARTNVHRNKWQPPEPRELFQLLQDRRRRLVRNDGELADLLIETISQIEADLSGHSELLWNALPKSALTDRQKKKGISAAWRPKTEAALCAYLVNELRHWLAGHGLAINREVMIKPTDQYGAGDRTDILVEAHFANTSVLSQYRDPLRVVIEVKGSWNADLLISQRNQLADRYLREFQTATGIYLIGWFNVELWTDSNDRRRNTSAALDLNAVKHELDAQAKGIQAEFSKSTRPVLMFISRPITSAEETTLSQPQD